MYGFDMKLAMVITYLGIALMYFSFSVDVVLSRLVYLESYVVPGLF